MFTSLFQIAKNTFRESLREPIYLLITLVAICLIGLFPIFSLFVFNAQEKLVVDSKIISKAGYLLDSLLYMIENENNIREHLKEIIPEYRKSTYGVRENLRSLFNS